MTQEKNELHKTIWKIAEELRGSVDGWDFKSYVLGMLFYRFISENLTTYLNNEERRINPDFDYSKLNDSDALLNKNEIIENKGFFILPSELFENVLQRAKDDENLNTTLTILKISKTLQ